MSWSNANSLLRLDCTEMVDYNMKLLNGNNLTESFFCLDKEDPTNGFLFDVSHVFGPTFPPRDDNAGEGGHQDQFNDLRLRLTLGSHLARHLRHELESQKGYTATVGIATNKVLSKLVGNVNKPKSQTTIVPPYEPVGSALSTVALFMDNHDIGKVPGIGFKLAQKIRARILGRAPEIQDGLVVGWTKESINVGEVRSYPGMGPEMLEDILSGPGSQKGIGGKIWELLHGINNTEVAEAKRVPSQISQEDSYMKYLHTFEQVRKQLHLLSERLIRRMHIDLMENDDEVEGEGSAPRKWLAHPRTLRLTTRPRRPLGQDGVRPRTFHRISRSAPMPNFVFSLRETPAALADKLVECTLLDMFRKLHPEKSGWNLSLINLAVTNMSETAAETKGSEGRDIGRMFRRQDHVLKDFQVRDDAPGQSAFPFNYVQGEAASADVNNNEDQPDADWDVEDADVDDPALETCNYCHATIPNFAMMAHQQFHQVP